MVDMTNYVGIGQMKISNNPEDVLIAANLGSCLGVAIYETNLKLGGLIHCLLPLSKSNIEKANNEPCAFVDTGIVVLLNEMLSLGAQKKDLLISVAGGSSINDRNHVFDIGGRNYTILKKILWKNGLLLKGQDVGDSISRTVTLNIATGEVHVKTNCETKRIM